MNSNHAKIFRHSIIGYLLCLCLSFIGMAEASSFKINIKNALIDIEAKKVPLMDIPKNLSLKTGLAIKTEDSLTDSITLHLYKATTEACLRRLLANRNYVLLFRKTENNIFVPLEVRIIGNNALKTINTANGFASKATSDMGIDPLNVEDYRKRYSQKWFEEKIQNKNKLATQLSATPTDTTADFPEKPAGGGILIKNISKNSIFDTIGIQKGDIISDVNGSSIKSKDDFIDTLQNSPGKLPLIRIERLRNNHEIDPIYIELN